MADEIVQFRVIKTPNNARDLYDAGNGWGGTDHQVWITYPNGNEFDWLTVGLEPLVRLHAAIGSYLAKKALDDAQAQR